MKHVAGDVQVISQLRPVSSWLCSRLQSELKWNLVACRTLIQIKSCSEASTLGGICCSAKCPVGDPGVIGKLLQAHPCPAQALKSESLWGHVLLWKVLWEFKWKMEIILKSITWRAFVEHHNWELLEGGLGERFLKICCQRLGSLSSFSLVLCQCNISLSW